MSYLALLCDREHECRRCHKIVYCGLAPFVCPWLNNDEWQYCPPCEELEADEMVAFWNDEKL